MIASLWLVCDGNQAARRREAGKDKPRQKLPLTARRRKLCSLYRKSRQIWLEHVRYGGNTSDMAGTRQIWRERVRYGGNATVDTVCTQYSPFP